jgi:hypothetical protein
MQKIPFGIFITNKPFRPFAQIDQVHLNIDQKLRQIKTGKEKDNMKQQQKLLFVLGRQKTASSSMVALLNAHPDIFILYEAKLFLSTPTRRVPQFVKKWPDSRSLFVENINPLQSYQAFAEWLISKGFFYTYFGDKIPDISREMMHQLNDSKVIYTIRDVRSWLIKEQIREMYVVDEDIVPVATDYCKHFCSSFLLPSVLHVKFDDFINQNTQLINDTCRFLDVTPTNTMQQWWNAFDHYDEMKRTLRWWNGHASSQRKPFSDDTTYTLKTHPFWDKILPIFEKYYSAIGSSFSQKEIDNDLSKLDEIRASYRVTINEGYATFSSFSLSKGRQSNKKTKKNCFKKIASRMKQAILRLGRFHEGNR